MSKYSPRIELAEHYGEVDLPAHNRQLPHPVQQMAREAHVHVDGQQKGVALPGLGSSLQGHGALEGGACASDKIEKLVS